MSGGFSDYDKAVLYDNSIEDMLAAAAEEPLNDREVMFLSDVTAAVNAYRNRKGRKKKLAALPPALHAQINTYAKAGMLKGKGRRRPNESVLARLYKQAGLVEIAEFACKRKEDRLNASRKLIAEAEHTESLAKREKLRRQAEDQGTDATGANGAHDKAIADTVAFARQQHGLKLTTNAIEVLMRMLRSGRLPEIWGSEKIKKVKKIKSI
ncbi:hypothetical protein [Bradyrhizobium sp. BR 1433]|uniref:hypothetical protein n=1 Tax=Bradyrhizobium sp. BR 1433 TaxID=3447967 RepID=UPI003EE6AAB5